MINIIKSLFRYRYRINKNTASFLLLYQIKLCKDEDILDHTIPGNYNFLVEKSDDE